MLMPLAMRLLLTLTPTLTPTLLQARATRDAVRDQLAHTENEAASVLQGTLQIINARQSVADRAAAAHRLTVASPYPYP